MRMIALSLAAAVVMAAPARAEPAEVIEAAGVHPWAQVHAGDPAALEMACHTLDTDFDDPHAHGDQLCVLVLEHGGRYQLVGQWIQRAPPADAGAMHREDGFVVARAE